MNSRQIEGADPDWFVLSCKGLEAGAPCLFPNFLGVPNMAEV